MVTDLPQLDIQLMTGYLFPIGILEQLSSVGGMTWSMAPVTIP